MTIEFITLPDVSEFADKVAEYYEKQHKLPTGVYGIPRGGLVPAVMFSHKLNVPLLAAPCKGCLIIDDIAETGESILHYNRMGYDIATIIVGPDCPVMPKFYYRKRTQDWIKFFWEIGTMKDILEDADNYYSKKGD